ncbi:thiol protease/hemagglutinin PrtT [Bacteroides nordii]|uniref:thiol protease/hemagglutinin PrtT n=1 Tax=Bacteroides nordii TaxID=291645 RepID=UPI001CBFBE75|nr:thiol protease/hemagglutinin PrtT [Bacteroides nordii]UAK42719.1 thiol protease/hemagglutinin PrtT [Bacteroides nordii]
MKCFLFLVFCCIPFSFFAKNVDVITAEKIAKFVLTGVDTQTRSNEIDVSLIWTGEDVCTRMNNSPAYYVFNKVGGNGFVIVSGDDIIKPILAYSYVNSFHVENMPDNLRAWMAYYREQINWAREENIVSDEETIWDWERLRDEIDSAKNSEEVLIETALWDQTAPYNLLCPTINGTQAPTGCVATALAIVMKYNRWPDQGSGMTFQYTTKQYKQTLSATYNIVYDWDNMLNKYEKGNYSTEQAEAVSQLMYHCGVFSEMDYTPRSSGALTLTAMGGMVRYMKYDKSMTLQSREWYTEAEWNSLLKKELDAGRLIIYGGSNNKEEGHQFVLDGYKQNDYHVNWGWGGTANGYYSLSALDPDSQGVGGNTGGGFTVGQDAVIGVKKSEEGSGYCDNLAFMSGSTESGEMFSGLTTTETNFIPRVRFTVKAGFYINYGIRNFSGAIVLALVDKHGNIKEFITREVSVNSLKIGYGSGNVFSCSIANIPEEGDRIWMMYKSQDGNEWKRIRGDRDTITEIIVKELPVSVVENVDFSDANLIAVTNDMTKTIYIKSPIPILELSLVDIKGRIIKKTEGLESVDYTLSYSNCIDGTYIVQVVTSAGMSSTKVIIK